MICDCEACKEKRTNDAAEQAAKQKQEKSAKRVAETFRKKLLEEFQPLAHANSKMFIYVKMLSPVLTRIGTSTGFPTELVSLEELEQHLRAGWNIVPRKN